ncbi:MAG TPA: tetratricopeptide repeat protein [Anaeromyxobacteraceae bacterium]|nr:tetratricopeptide repeat protein [Anaeromyxobacteraceae bacterium]
MTPGLREGQAATPGSRAELATGFALALLAIAAHLPALSAGFVIDDALFVSGNPLLRGPFWSCFGTEGAADWLPLTQLSFWLEWHLVGVAPPVHHAVNVLLHATSALLLWRILRRLGVPGAALAGALFAVHPLASGSVAWVAERKNVLAGVFFAAAVWLWLRWEDRPRRRTWVGALACFALAILAKGAAVVLPACLLVLVWYRRGRVGRRDLAGLAPFAGLAAAGGAITVWFQWQVAIRGAPIDAGGPLARLLSAPRAVWFYALQSAWPSRLSFFYPRWRLDPRSACAWLPAAAVAVLALLAWRLRERWGRGPAAALAWFVVALSPVLGLIDFYWLRYSPVADHLAYFALPAPVSLAGAALSRLGRDPRSRHWAAAAAAVVLGSLAAAAWQRCLAFQSETTLYGDALTKNPEAWYAHLALADHLPPGSPERLQHLRDAARSAPSPSEAADALGMALGDSGRPLEAREAFARAAALDEGNWLARRHYALALYWNGELPAAIAALREVLRLAPDCGPCHYDLGVMLAAQGRLEDALREVQAARRWSPDNQEIAAGLARLAAARQAQAAPEKLR